MPTNCETTTTDVLIIGSGLAGLLAAIELERAGLNVLLATKTSLVESNTAWAQGGLAAVTPFNVLDSPNTHLADTIAAGAQLGNPLVAASIINDGQQLVTALELLGVHFDKDDSGNLELALEGGHSQRRVVHNKDTTGKTLIDVLTTYVTTKTKIRILEKAQATDLIIDDGSCLGAQFLVDNNVQVILSSYVILATGGIGQVFSRTTNPLVATGDGIAMAYRAGAQLIDMEFMQFHPTALCLPNQAPFLISEAVRGAGATLLDKHSERFLLHYDERGELATRDIVSRAIHSTMIEQGINHVNLDLRPIGKNLPHRFPTIFATCLQLGLDITKDLLPVAPAAHYFMGGIHTDLNGHTNINGLFAIGECACTGLHGANRLASNSLLEAGVMGLRVGRFIARNKDANLAASNNYHAHKKNSLAPYTIPHHSTHAKELFYNLAGLVRSEEMLTRCTQLIANSGSLAYPTNAMDIESANLLLVGSLIVESALRRQESRGTHWRMDYPAPNDGLFLGRQVISRQQYQWMPVSTLNTITASAVTAVA